MTGIKTKCPGGNCVKKASSGCPGGNCNKGGGQNNVKKAVNQYKAEIKKGTPEQKALNTVAKAHKMQPEELKKAVDGGDKGGTKSPPANAAKKLDLNG